MLIKVLFLCAVLTANLFATELFAKPGDKKPILPKQLIDVDGKTVDIAKLANEKKLFIVTLKATWCSVCFKQLLRLKTRLTELRICGATFIVLSPGPKDALKSIRKRTEFPYPFVEDKGLALAKKLKLQIAVDQIQPAIFAVNKKREIAWMQLGRNGSYYGDKELQEYLDCEFELAWRF